jgi:hypothetical protein
MSCWTGFGDLTRGSIRFLTEDFSAIAVDWATAQRSFWFRTTLRNRSVTSW